ncbi:MAG TPA: hypothetical protein ENJ09_14865 [Planctomycetes bacterium]|nr:hypothetical protein [Planctomycetota bacterium]
MEELTLAGTKLEALSVGGIETTIHLPERKVAFDIGRCPPPVVKRELVFFTHGHMDHMGGVAYHCATRALRGMRPPTYVVPPGYEDELEHLFDVWRSIDRSEMPHTTRTLAPGENFELPGGWRVRPFRAVHTAPAQGYALLRVRQKLRPEFLGRSGEELRRMRHEGTVLTEEVESVEFAFCGDTRVEVLEREELPRRARLLLLECTFVNERIGPELAREKGHLHLDDLAERAGLLADTEALLLHHFSPRFSRPEILGAIGSRLPASLRARTTALLGGHR